MLIDREVVCLKSYSCEGCHAGYKVTPLIWQSIESHQERLTHMCVKPMLWNRRMVQMFVHFVSYCCALDFGVEL